MNDFGYRFDESLSNFGDGVKVQLEDLVKHSW